MSKPINNPPRVGDEFIIQFNSSGKTVEGNSLLTFIPVKPNDGFGPKSIQITQQQWDELQYHFMKGIDDKNNITKLAYIY